MQRHRFSLFPPFQVFKWAVNDSLTLQAAQKILESKSRSKQKIDRIEKKSVRSSFAMKESLRTIDQERRPTVSCYQLSRLSIPRHLLHLLLHRQHHWLLASAWIRAFSSCSFLPSLPSHRLLLRPQQLPLFYPSKQPSLESCWWHELSRRLKGKILVLVSNGSSGTSSN